MCVWKELSCLKKSESITLSEFSLVCGGFNLPHFVWYLMYFDVYLFDVVHTLWCLRRYDYLSSNIRGYLLLSKELKKFKLELSKYSCTVFKSVKLNPFSLILFQALLSFAYWNKQISCNFIKRFSCCRITFIIWSNLRKNLN